MHAVGNVYLYGILGYYNGPYLMNEICESLYSNKKMMTKARNINLLDMEKHLTPKGIAARNSYMNAANIKYGTTKTYTDTRAYYPLLYSKQKGAGVNSLEDVIQPDISNGNDPYEESKPLMETEPTTDTTKIYAKENGFSVTQTYYQISINSDNYGDAAEVLTSGNYYWVASRYVDTCCQNSKSGLVFGLRTASFSMYGNNASSPYQWRRDGEYSRLRPVVTIKIDLLSGDKDSDGAWNLK